MLQSFRERRLRNGSTAKLQWNCNKYSWLWLGVKFSSYLAIVHIKLLSISKCAFFVLKLYIMIWLLFAYCFKFPCPSNFCYMCSLISLHPLNWIFIILFAFSSATWCRIALGVKYQQNHFRKCTLCLWVRLPQSQFSVWNIVPMLPLSWDWYFRLTCEQSLNLFLRANI